MKIYFFGIEDKYEYIIYSQDKNHNFLYDFTIKSKKLIIEYNGDRWYPNYEKCDIEYLKENWTSIWNNNLNLEKIIEREKIKIQTAVDKGFKILVIWSDNSKEENWNKMYSFLEENDIYIR